MNPKITSILQKVSSSSGPGDVLWSIRSDDARVHAQFGDPDEQFFIASATKLYVTAILTQLRSEGRLDWASPIADLLPHLPIREMVGDATVQEVMAHTSGLGDYFEGKHRGGSPFFELVMAEDRSWNVNDVVAWTADVRPGVRGKGLYSDTGYQLLGALIERIDARSFAASVQQRITQPLALKRTYVFSLGTIDTYNEIATIFAGDTPLHIPLAMASVQADGGIVSTLNDGQTFMQAFFDGTLFPKDFMVDIARDWHAIFRPLEYGTGIMRFRLPRIATGLRKVPPFIGHSGASGTVMFRCPERGLTIVGTINQLRKRSLPYRVMIQTALAA